MDGQQWEPVTIDKRGRRGAGESSAAALARAGRSGAVASEKKCEPWMMALYVNLSKLFGIEVARVACLCPAERSVRTHPCGSTCCTSKCLCGLWCKHAQKAPLAPRMDAAHRRPGIILRTRAQRSSLRHGCFPQHQRTRHVCPTCARYSRGRRKSPHPWRWLVGEEARGGHGALCTRDS